MALKSRNILPNSYIPVLSKKVIMNLLDRLPVASLTELALLWPKLVHTQPHLEKENSTQSQLQFNKWVIDDIKLLIQEHSTSAKSGGLPSTIVRRIPKRKLLLKLVYDYWSRGLNLLQISQIDCQILVDRPNSYNWILSTVKDQGGLGKEVPLSLNPQQFLDTLARDLSDLFITYIYVCKHPQYPMIIIRIQVFDLHPGGVTEKIPKPHISSHKPFFLALPENSPKIIHSLGSNVVTKIILQAVERSLKQDPTNLLAITTTPNQKPVSSLKSMYIFNGSSRFGNSLGVWTSYADGTVESLPLRNNKQEKESTTEQDEDDQSPLDYIKKIANIRFRGTANGKFKSETFYDIVNYNKKGPKRVKRAVTYSVEDSEDEEFLGNNENGANVCSYASIAPVQYVEYSLQNKVSPLETNQTSIELRLSGDDIFAGLHELSVLTANSEEMVVDPTTIPSWLTGEEGARSGVVKDGQFKPH